MFQAIKNKSVLIIFALYFINSCAAQTNTQEIHWVDLETAQKLNAQEPRKILIDIYTDWCGWCKKLDAYTYHDPAVVEYINQNFYAVKLNAETHDTVFFNGTSYTYNPTYKVNMVSQNFMMGSNGYPTTTILDEKLNVLNAMPGYLEAKPMLSFLKYFGDNIYKTKSWTTYQQEQPQ